MVKIGFFFFLIMIGSHQAHALLPQTERDLRVAEDALRYELGKEPTRAWTPILVATPEWFWQESKEDFAPAVMAMLTRVFSDTGSLISCGECRQSRVFVSRDQRTVVNNGELSLTDLASLRGRQGYQDAKTLLVARETPGGIEIRVTDLNDGKILFFSNADATRGLKDALPPLNLAREMDRRMRGEALSYVFMDFGFLPDGLVQMKWLEQWGDRNQHISGLALSFYNPIFAIGGSYHYMLPWNRRFMVSATAYYSLTSVFDTNSETNDKMILQGMLQYAISGSYGIFISADSQSRISLGLSLLNPVLLPFLL